MTRFAIVFTALLAGVGVASANDAFSCRALGTTEPVLTFAITKSGNAFSITNATFQLDGRAYSTGDSEQANQVTVTGINLDNQVTFTLENDGKPVITTNLVTRFEGGGNRAAGNARVGASRILVLNCDVTRQE